MPGIGVSYSGDIGPATPDNSIPAVPALSRTSGHGTLDAAQAWALCAPRLSARDRVRLSPDGGRNYPRTRETALTVRLPAQPAAVYVYHHGMTRLLAADFDVGRAAAQGAADPRAAVAADAADFAALITSCGGAGFGDCSPSGGQHAYVLWAANIYFGDMRRVALALARRYPTFDPQPLLNISDGLIRPPGSRHRSGGHQMLTTPPGRVRWVLEHPNGAEVWSRLLDALQPELESLSLDSPPAADPAAMVPAPRRPKAGPSDGPMVVDELGDTWVPRPGGPLPRLSPRLERLAVSGVYDARQYDSPSEARQAVISGAVACGWRLADVVRRLNDRTWPGLAGFYTRYGDPRKRLKAVRADWEKAVAWSLGRESGREIHTRGNTHTGGAGPSLGVGGKKGRPPMSGGGDVGELQQIRRWNSAMRSAEPYRWTGAQALTVRRVLRALLAAAQRRRSTVVGFGVRHLALLAGLDESTVAKVLRLLREEPDPFIDLVRPHHGERADVYRLVIPEAYGEAAAWRRWQPGRLGGVHPVFRVLGSPAAFLYEHLTSDVPAQAAVLGRLAGLSPTAVSTGLRTLAEHGLAERTRGGWVRGPEELDGVAERLGVPELVAEVVERYRRQRAEWKRFLSVVEAFGRTGAEPWEHLVPLQAVADAGPPAWVDNDAHAPPVVYPVVPASGEDPIDFGGSAQGRDVSPAHGHQFRADHIRFTR
ncbi:hypothetical protein GCM10017673_37470 [Streptosporangium violaceochromogenes]|nr:hypothetical protein GCM10017673_37470 [Streptosporangium violaceochromogenes]